MDEGVFLKLVSFGDEVVINKPNLRAGNCNAAPYFLAEKLNYNFVDCAKVDTCNRQIFKDVIEYSLDANNDFLLIGWTHKQRLEINWKEKSYTYRPNVNEYIDNGINSLHRFDDILFNDILLTQHWASEVFTLQQILEHKKIKYYMYNTQDSMCYNKKTKYYIDALSKTHYHNTINIDSSMKYFLQKQKFDVLNRQAHILWSNFLFDKINAGDLL